MIFNASKPKTDSASIPTVDEILSTWKMYDFEGELYNLVESGETSGTIEVEVAGSIDGVAIATRADSSGYQMVNVIPPYQIEAINFYETYMFIYFSDLDYLCLVNVKIDDFDGCIYAKLESVEKSTGGFENSIDESQTYSPEIYIKQS